MSFILDALRKAEHARQMSTGATLAELPIGRRSRSLPWWVFALGGLLLVNMAVLALVLWRDDGETQTSAETAGSVAAPPAAQVANAPAATSPLANEALPAPEVEYETVSRSELEIANAAAAVPDGPTIVRPADSSAPLAEPLAASPVGDLHVDLHVYSDSPRDRFVMINMKRYTEGQRLPDGSLIEQITPGGVVLLQKGERSMLHR